MSIINSIANGLAFNASRTTSATRPNDSSGIFGALFSRPVAGEPVNKDTALTYDAVFACVRLISEHLAMMPHRVYVSDGDQRSIDSSNPVDRLLYRQANEETNAFDFKQSLFAAALLQGNGLAEIERLRDGTPVALWWIDWERVSLARTSTGRLVYEVRNNNQANTYLQPSNVVHLKGFSLDGLSGLSVIAFAKQAISLGLAMEKFGAAFFGNGAMPGGVIEWSDSAVQPEGWNNQAAKNMKRSWNKNHRGAGRNGQIEILEPGQTFKGISIAPDEAQFLESRQFGVTEICRWFGVPPHKLAQLDRATNANIEMQNIEYVTDCLMRWAIRYEQEINAKLLTGNEYNKFSFNSLLRGDLKTRQEFYKTMMDRGVYSINEVRALEDENPVSGGELRLVQMNMTSLEQANSNGHTAQTAQTGKDNV